MLMKTCSYLSFPRRLLRLTALLFLFPLCVAAQRVKRPRPTTLNLKPKYIFFPYPMSHKQELSVGFNSTTMPIEITEEVRYRIPAADIMYQRRLPGKWRLRLRGNLQVLQNLFSVTPEWNRLLSNRVSLGVGSELGFWFGNISIGGIDTRGHGWQNLPFISVGYRFNKQILLTGRAELITTFGIHTFAGGTEVSSQYPFTNGSAYSLILEQPFFKNKSLALGFRAIYTNFYWQTWTLFEAYDKNLFFPQVIVAVIL